MTCGACGSDPLDRFHDPVQDPHLVQCRSVGRLAVPIEVTA